MGHFWFGTGFLLADRGNKAEIVAALLQAGAKVTDQSTAGQTPLISAASFNTNPMVRGLNPKAVSSEGKLAEDHMVDNIDLYRSEIFWKLSEFSE